MKTDTETGTQAQEEKLRRFITIPMTGGSGMAMMCQDCGCPIKTQQDMVNHYCGVQVIGARKAEEKK